MWNTIQRRLVERGELHPSLLGYWARRLLFWVVRPAHAFRFALSLIAQYAPGGLSPALAAGLVITAYGKFQPPPPERTTTTAANTSSCAAGTVASSSSSPAEAATAVGSSDNVVVGRLLPVRKDMVRRFFVTARAFERFLNGGVHAERGDTPQ